MSEPTLATLAGIKAEYEACVSRAFAQRDRYKEALERIKGNAESMLIAQNAIGTPDDAPERINARWVYSEAIAALRPE